ncbi:DUF4267 domain-containing protein [Nocardia thailandica]
MSRKNLTTVLATATVLFTFYLAYCFILTPTTSAPGFGLPTWPDDGDGFLIVKGCRELAMGLGSGILLVTGQRRALGWILLTTAVAPLGDMINVLAHHGSTAVALSVHGLTSALIAITGVLLLRETSTTGATHELHTERSAQTA